MTNRTGDDPMIFLQTEKQWLPEIGAIAAPGQSA